MTDLKTPISNASSTHDGDPILQVKDLSTHFFTDDGEVKAVRHVSFDLYPGETLGIVGESGCGKSVTVMSILGLVAKPGRVVNGEILFKGKDVLKLGKQELRHLRGGDVAMVFQDPLSSLNPVLRIGYQLDEAMNAHEKIPHNAVKARSIELLKTVRVPDAEDRVREYPHQFSGGMRQRSMIAMGLSNNPEILIADEPTTALDVTVQAQILELIRDLNNDTGASIILVTHNMGVVASLCTRVIVMYAGQIVEEGPVDQIFKSPQHPYTWSLLRSVPRIDSDRGQRLRSIEGLPPDLIAPPKGCAFAPRCPFRVEQCFSEDPPLVEVGSGQKAACWVTMNKVHEKKSDAEILDTRPGAVSGVHPPGRPPLAPIESLIAPKRATIDANAAPLLRVNHLSKFFPAGWRGSVKAVDDVSFEIRPGETLGLVGESGCGKSTLGRVISQLIPATSGEVIFDGIDLTKLRGESLRKQRQHMQMIFQDPFASLDPRMTVGDIIAEPLENFGLLRHKDKNDRVQELLKVVGLNPYFNNRYPHEFSGGQRQRIGIARALALNPKLIVCDEPVSALDVSIQAQIINLLFDLQQEFHLTYLFIAHDLSVVRHISDRILVMYLGKLAELAPSEEITSVQKHPYTTALLSAVPVPDPRVQVRRKLVELSSEIPSPLNPPTGCRFHTRCPIAQVPGICSEVDPPMEEKSPGHWAACHFSDRAMETVQGAVIPPASS